MSIPVLYANDVDLYAVYGFAPTNLDGWWDRPNIDRDTVSPYGLLGVVPAPLARVRAQQWPLEGVLIAESPAQRRERLDDLNTFLQGIIAWRLVDAERVAYGEVVGSRATVMRRGRWGEDGRGSDLGLILNVAFYDLAKYDVNATTVGDIDDAPPVEIPQGSAPSFGVTTITAVGGTVTDPELIARDGEGEIIGNMPFIISLPEDDYLEIDHAAHTVTLYTNDVASDGLEYFDFENGWWFSLPPGAPTLEVTEGIASHEYRRRWL
jgi:phage-related protein